MKSGLKLKEVDYQIIRELQLDARKSFTDIAKELGVSANSVGYRFKRLEEEKIVKGSTLILDLTKLPRLYIVLVKTTCGKQQEVAESLNKEFICSLQKLLPSISDDCLNTFFFNAFDPSSVKGFLYELGEMQLKEFLKKLESWPDILQVNTIRVIDFEDTPDKVCIQPEGKGEKSGQN